MATVLVTGGAGFIGAHTAARLVADGHDVTVLDPLRLYNEPHGPHDVANLRYRREHLLAGVELVTGSTESRAELTALLGELGPTHIVHCGALPLATRAMEDSSPAFRSIVEGTHVLLESIREAQVVERLVYVSSSMVYGDFTFDPQPETAAPAPKDVYGGMKYTGEVLVRVFEQTGGVPSVIVRPSAVYGPTDVNGRIVQKVVDAAQYGTPLSLRNPTSTFLDFSYVEDVAQGLVRALLAPVAGETFNITAGRGRSLGELYELVRSRKPDLSADVVEGESDFRPRRGALDITKARTLLDYEPRFTLETGLTAYMDFMDQLNVRNGAAAE